jgi:hypothetical protein
MKNIIALAAAFASITAATAHAADRAGQWMDVRNYLALGNIADSSEPMARLDYAKAFCHSETGLVWGAEPTRRTCAA